ncbi:hypothetical protein NDU88_010477 [Pleurodeles waltl]|uniref:Uncharacterized protein n=1 Tax=Pleurodeles waltl TaxID=8319 RepID=A0AAV7S0X2_PLEWA|nr:hypothetical protein NDU88_010477 [Pleurodeles waltl]
MGDWVRVKKPYRVKKNESQYFEPEQVMEVLHNTVKLSDGKVWNLKRIALINNEEYIMWEAVGLKIEKGRSDCHRQGSKETEEPEKHCCITSKEDKKAVKRKGDGDKLKIPQEAAPITSKKLRPVDGGKISMIMMEDNIWSRSERKENPATAVLEHSVPRALHCTFLAALAILWYHSLQDVTSTWLRSWALANLDSFQPAPEAPVDIPWCLPRQSSVS